MKWIQFSYKIFPILLGIATLAFFADRRADFAAGFEKSLMAIYPELQTEKLDVTSDRAYAIFVLPHKATPGDSNTVNLESLTSDIRKIYCAQIAKTKSDLHIPLFHVSVRKYSRGDILFTHSFDPNGCV